MAKSISKIVNFAILAASGGFFNHAIASDVVVTANASSELTYSDNIDLTRSNGRSGLISIWSAGTTAQLQGNDGNVFFNYDVYQSLHSVDSARNELYNELSFSADKAVHRDNIVFQSDASITNIARSIEDNANADIISGDTIETRSLNALLSYQSNPRGVINLYGAFDAGLTSNQDSVGDNYRFGTDVVLKDGTASKRLLWLTDYSYNRTYAQESNNQYYDYTFEQEVGLKPTKHIAPLIRVYYEGYTSSEGGSTTESGSWGPAVRYYWHERSYLELGYDFSFKDKDFWRGSLVFNPNSRTLLEFDYTRRFFGDAYEFSLNHTSKRLTNTISYTEEVRNFERRFLLEGQDIEEYQLVKELSLNSTLDLRRTSFTFEVRTSDRASLDDNTTIGNSNLYGGSVSATQRLSSKTSLSGGFGYDKKVFDPSTQLERSDYYRLYDISLTHQLSESISWDVSLYHANSSRYRESRASINFDIVY